MIELEEIPEHDSPFISRLPLFCPDPPMIDQNIAVENSQDGIRIPHVNDQQHRTSLPAQLGKISNPKFQIPNKFQVSIPNDQENSI
jgi:hypothetical protein